LSGNSWTSIVKFAGFSDGLGELNFGNAMVFVDPDAEFTGAVKDQSICLSPSLLVGA
jgi:hypothetical protein